MGRYLIIVILLMAGISVCGQAVVQFVPEVSGRNVDGLFQCKILNPGRAQSAVLTITVTERTRGTICQVKTQPFNVVQGNNPVPYSAARNASVQFPNNSLGRLVQVSHQFPEGDYDYCFTVKLSQSDLPEEQCFSYQLAPFADLNLIEPYDKDKVCDTKPLFSWQPLIPAVPGAYYQLVLAEVRSGQNATEALNYNFPVINLSSIVAPILPYPAVARELQKGKQYAWQVTAYKDQTILNRSEVWTFKLDCQDSVKVVNDNGYRDIEDLIKGNYYIAAGVLKFALVNPYQKHPLKYNIISLADPEKKIRGLPKFNLETGKNKIVIDLAENGHFTAAQYYILEVWLPNGTLKSLRFLYSDAE